MTGQVTIRLPARRGGRRGPAVGADEATGGPGAPASPPPERVPRVARVLALAHHWQGLIRSGAVRDQADFARLVGVSRARVTQVMSLLWLAPVFQEELLDPRTSSTVSERALRHITTHVLWSEQRAQAGHGLP